MDPTYLMSSGCQIIFLVAAIAILATWPRCRSRLPLILSLLLSTLQTVLWLTLVLVPFHEFGWLFTLARVTSLGTTFVSSLLLLIFVILMRTELRDLLLAAEGPGGTGGISPPDRDASPDASRDPRYATRFDARHDTRHDPRNDPGYHPRQDG